MQRVGLRGRGMARKNPDGAFRTVSHASQTSLVTVRDQIFISYSRQDHDWLKTLEPYLKPLVDDHRVTVWSDQAIAPGRDWKAEIDQAVAAARIAVLIVSQDFLASDFIIDHELPALFAARAKGELQILWIAARHSVYQKTPLGSIQALNDPRKPLHAIPRPEREKVLVDIAGRIMAAYDAMKEAASARDENSPVLPHPSTAVPVLTPPQAPPELVAESPADRLHARLWPHLLDRITLEQRNSFITDARRAKLSTVSTYRRMRELQRFAHDARVPQGFFLAPVWNERLAEWLPSIAWNGVLSARAIDGLATQARSGMKVSTSALNVLGCLTILSMASRGIPVTLDSEHASGFDLMKAIRRGTPPEFILLSNSGLAFAGHPVARQYRLLLTIYADEQRLFERQANRFTNRRLIHIVRYSSSQEGLSLLLKDKRLGDNVGRKWTTIEKIIADRQELSEGESTIVWGGLASKYAEDETYTELVDGRHLIGVSLFCHSSMVKKRDLLQDFCEAFVACWNRLGEHPLEAAEVARRNPAYEGFYSICIGR